MSPLKARPARLVLFGAILVVCAPGCQGLPTRHKTAEAGPPAPASAAPPGEYDDDDEQSGWLFRNITGQKSAATQPDSSVQPASATLPSEVPASEAVKAAVAEAEEVEKADDTPFTLADLAPTKVYANLKEMAGYGPDETVARTLYEEGTALFGEARYADAAGKFKSAAKRWPDSSLEEDALFMQGESYFFADKYPEAKEAYEALLKKYDYTRHLDKVTRRLFLVGRYWEQRAAGGSVFSFFNLTDSSRPWADTFGNALKAYEDIRMYDPTGPLADDSVMATGNAHFLKGRYEDAAQDYDLLRKEYAKSDHQLEAHLLGMESWMHVYQGAKYDGGPLEKAQEIADQALVQFGSELGQHRHEVLDARNGVIEEKANRDWMVGQYYDKKKCYGAAAFYYRAIIEEYPQTEAAGRARARLDEVRDLPAEPPKHFQWFTRWFEEDR